jgi:hypothetical protein
VTALALVIFAFGAVLAQLVLRGSAVAKPDDPCVSPPLMQTYQGVTLQPEAMKAFKRAESLAGRPIEVVQSYRSCARQALACQRICSNANGCPGTCASPGSSYHQLGAAIDIPAALLRDAGVIDALEKAGWCEPLPETDPGHFSFGGCH